MAGQVGLVDLHHVGVEVAHLLGEHIGQGVGEIGGGAVVAVEQRLGQHVRAGEGELEGPAGQRRCPLAGAGQVERAAADRAVDDAGRPGAKAHPRHRPVGHDLVEAHGVADAGHGPDEVLDHPVGLGMVEVEAVELAVADDVDARRFLGGDDDARGVDQSLLGRRRREPVGHRVGADDRGLDSRRSGHARCPYFGILIERSRNSLV
jgi:hypothetical protein